jgi:hypothetical protein
MVISFGKEIQPLAQLSQFDFTHVINSRLFDFYIVHNSVLFIEGESYQILSNGGGIHYTRAWMNRVKTKEKNDVLFDFASELNGLGLSQREKGLLVARLFTLPPDENIKNKLKKTHDYFNRALLDEFQSNGRNTEFLNEFEHVISKLKLVKIIYESD